MIKLQNVLTPVNLQDSAFEIVAKTLKISVKNIKNVKLFKRAIDARKKQTFFIVILI